MVKAMGGFLWRKTSETSWHWNLEGTLSWENTANHPKSFCLRCRTVFTDETTWIFFGAGVTTELWIPISHVLLMHDWWVRCRCACIGSSIATNGAGTLGTQIQWNHEAMLSQVPQATPGFDPGHDGTHLLAKTSNFCFSMRKQHRKEQNT